MIFTEPEHHFVCQNISQVFIVLGICNFKSHLLDDAIRRFAVAALDDAIVQG